jgi:hypothetical protein
MIPFFLTMISTVIKVKISVDKKKREATVDRHIAAAEYEFQHARAGGARRRALCFA